MQNFISVQKKIDLRPLPYSLSADRLCVLSIAMLPKCFSQKLLICLLASLCIASTWILANTHTTRIAHVAGNQKSRHRSKRK